MQITIWDLYVKQKDGSFKWEFNHIEDGFDEPQMHPTPKFPIQEQTFSKGVWRKASAELIGNEIFINGIKQ